MSTHRTLARALRRLSRESSPGFSLVELMAFMLVMVTLAAFVLPFTRSSLNALNLGSDARNLSSAASLAKMRAAASFTQARIYVDLGAGTFHIERWQKNPGAWVPEGTVRMLSSTVTFGFGGLAAPPPNTQGVIGQAAPCLDTANQPIAGTACIVFNSRGVSVDATNTATPSGALYASDGVTVYGVTVSSGGMVQLWRANVADAVWALN